MAFTSDNHLVLATQDASLQVLAMDSIQPTMVHSFPSLSDSINLLTVSEDDKCVAVSDLSGEIHVYNLERGKVGFIVY